MIRDYSVPSRRPRRRSRLHLPVAGAVAAALLIALVARPGDAARHERIEVQPPRPVAADDRKGELDTTSAASKQASSAGMTASGPVGPLDAGEYSLVPAAVTPPEDAIAQPPDEVKWQSVTVAPGQTLSGAFDELGLGPSQWMPLLELEESGISRLRRPRAGDRLQVQSEDGELLALRVELDELRTLHIEREGADFEAWTQTANVERRPAFAYGEIESSLFLSGKAAGMSDRLIMSMVQVLGYDIDFALDLREKDQFIVVYEELFRDGDKIRDGKILAIEFINRGRTVHALRYEDEDGYASYYRPDGQAVKTAFLRNPLDVVRISSHFNPNRRHPVLNTIRAHQGTDYAAPTGTPIKTTGKGRVVHAGPKGGYGNVVIVKHGGTYRTLYAHMSRLRSGIRTGTNVRQGETIGYVGSSGLATGPHLHFEFLVNGVHRNPLTVPLPRAEPVAESQMARFRSQTQPYIAQIEALRRTQTADAGGR